MAIADQVLRVLKKAGVEVEGDALAEVKSGIESLKLGEADRVVGSDELAIKESDYNDMKKNLRELRSLKNQLTEENEDKDRTIKSLKTEIDESKPMAEKLASEALSRWDRLKDRLPAADSESDQDKQLRGLFKFPEKEGDKLPVGDVISNLGKFNELESIGYFKRNGEVPDPPLNPRPKPKDKPDRMEGKSIGERLATMYKDQAPEKKGAQDNR